jgi:hypothetical protein
MCWNKDVSIQTFAFTSFVIILIFFAKHKPVQFESIYMYIFLLSVTFMQLCEYFIWISIETRDDALNKISSFFAWFLIRVVQPISALFLLPDKYIYLRSLLLPSYVISLVGTTIYKSIFNPIQFKTVVNKNGHLGWLWNKLDGGEIINLIMYWACMSTLFLGFPIGFVLSFIALLFSVFRYNYTWGSNWCYLVNAIMIYYFIEVCYKNRSIFC